MGHAKCPRCRGRHWVAPVLPVEFVFVFFAVVFSVCAFLPVRVSSRVVCRANGCLSNTSSPSNEVTASGTSSASTTDSVSFTASGTLSESASESVSSSASPSLVVTPSPVPTRTYTLSFSVDPTFSFSFSGSLSTALTLSERLMTLSLSTSLPLSWTPAFSMSVGNFSGTAVLTTSALVMTTSELVTVSPSLQSVCPKCKNGFCEKDADHTKFFCRCFTDTARGFWSDGEYGGICEHCLAGYWGADCRNQCPPRACDVCSGHGTCRDGLTGNGTCQCRADNVSGYWGGPSCSVCSDAYFGFHCTSKCDCNGHGICAQGRFGTGNCICRDGWSGSDCSLCDPNVVHDCVRCPNLCSGHGTCAITGPFVGQCTCERFFATEDCSVLCPRYCSRSGTCFDGRLGNGTCLCFPGFVPPSCSDCLDHLYGEKCNMTCDCSGHGRCDRVSGVCRCAHGYVGAACNVSCPVGSDGVSVCSGNGACVDPGNCACTRNSRGGFWAGVTCDVCVVGYAGPRCTLLCPRSTNGAICANRGVCHPINATCVCINATFCSASCEGVKDERTGVCEPCSDPAMFGRDCASRCQCSRGRCDAGMFGTGRCFCIPGWGGEQCDNECPGGAALPCSGHGECIVASATCACHAGYGTANCSTACVNCGSHGACDAGATGSGRCICQPGWVWPDISIDNNNTACGFRCDCHGHGTCLSNLSCACEPGWTSDGCDSCVSGRSGAACNKRCVFGRTAGTACVCNSDVGGHECEVRCPVHADALCGGNGLCDDGYQNPAVCVCFPPWIGPSCQCNQDVCTGRFACNAVSGACVCRGNRAGAQCTECVATVSWGADCTEPCQCSFHGFCDQFSGRCLCDRDATRGFWTGARCDRCADGYIGTQCAFSAVFINQFSSFQSRYGDLPQQQTALTINTYIALVGEGLVVAGGTDYHAVFNKSARDTTDVVTGWSTAERPFCEWHQRVWIVGNQQYFFGSRRADRGRCGDLSVLTVGQTAPPSDPNTATSVLITTFADIVASVMFVVEGSSGGGSDTTVLCLVPRVNDLSLLRLCCYDASTRRRAGNNNGGPEEPDVVVTLFRVRLVKHLIFSPSLNALVVGGSNAENTCTLQFVRVTVSAGVGLRLEVVEPPAGFSFGGGGGVSPAPSSTNAPSAQNATATSSPRTSPSSPSSSVPASETTCLSVEYSLEENGVLLFVMATPVGSRLVAVDTLLWTTSSADFSLPGATCSSVAVEKETNFGLVALHQTTGLTIVKFALAPRGSTTTNNSTDSIRGPLLTVTGSRTYVGTFVSQLIADSRSRLVFAVTRVSIGVVVLRFSLVDALSVSPVFADRRGGTMITIQGVGFDAASSTSNAAEATGRLLCRFGDAVSSARFATASAVVCPAPPTATSSCEPQLVELSLNGWGFTRNWVGVRRVDPPFLRSSTPSELLVTQPGVVFVSGQGFVPTGSLTCKYSDGIRAIVVPATYVSPRAVTCAAAASAATGMGDRSRRASTLSAVAMTQHRLGPNATLDVSLDGETYTKTPIPFRLIGVAVAVAAIPSVIQNVSSERTVFTTPLFIYTTDNATATENRLGALDTVERDVRIVFQRSAHTALITLTGIMRNGAYRVIVPDFTFPSKSTVRFNVTVSGMFETFFEVVILQGQLSAINITVEPPGQVFSGEPLRTNPKIALLDVAGNRWIPDSAIFVSLSSSSGDGVIRQRFPDSFVSGSGEVEFLNLILDTRFGLLYTLQFSLRDLPAVPAVRSGVITAQCAKIQYRFRGEDGELTCLPCPDGAVCNGTTTITLLPGYWRQNDTISVVYRCERTEMCAGGNPIGTCGAGYHGPLCTLCLHGFGKNLDGTCESCPDAGLTSFAMATAVVVSIASVGLFTLLAVQYCEKDREGLLCLQIIVSFFQSVGTLRFLDLQWPEAAARFLRYISLFSDFELHAVASDCALRAAGKNYLDKNAFYFSSLALFPLVGLVVKLVVTLFPSIFRAREMIASATTTVNRARAAMGLESRFVVGVTATEEGDRPSASSRPAPRDSLRVVTEGDDDGDGARGGDGTLTLSRRPGRNGKQRKRNHGWLPVMSTTFQVFIFLTAQTVADHAFNTFKCRTVYRQSIPERLLARDLSVSCDSAEYRVSYVAAIVVAVVYGFVIPVFMVVAMASLISRFTGKKELLRRVYLAFQLMGLRPQCWYWQVLVMVRKFIVLAASIVNTFPIDAYISMWTMMVYSFLVWYVQPYANPRVNHFEMVASLSIVLLVNIGAALIPYAPTWFVNLALVSVVLLLAAYAVFVGLGTVRRWASKVSSHMKLTTADPEDQRDTIDDVSLGASLSDSGSGSDDEPQQPAQGRSLLGSDAPPPSTVVSSSDAPRSNGQNGGVRRSSGQPRESYPWLRREERDAERGRSMSTGSALSEQSTNPLNTEGFRRGAANPLVESAGRRTSLPPHRSASLLSSSAADPSL